eukprot:819665_1
MTTIILLTFTTIIYTVLGDTPQGALSFDTITFNKIVDGSRNVLVKFDKKYAYGDNENAWKDFASTYATTSDLLLGEVGISEHGDNTNEELGTKYNINKDNYPQYRLFKSGNDINEPIKYENENIKSDELAQFLIKNGIYLSLNGCLKDFDELSKTFMNTNDKTQRDKIGIEGKELLNGYNGKEVEEKSGKYYMKVMAKITKEGDEYVEKEIKRLDTLLNGDTYIPDDKKPWFRKRLNILSVFKGSLSDEKKK